MIIKVVKSSLNTPSETAPDLVIGGASGYTWDQIKFWVNSIKRSGFQGDVVVVGTDISPETSEKLKSVGVVPWLCDVKESMGPRKTAPHTERFLHIWDYLTKSARRYRYVIATDTRDVVFQSNPSEITEKLLKSHALLVSSEGLKYRNEPWGNLNLLQTFGPVLHEHLKENLIYNVGTIAGESLHIAGLASLLFELSQNRPIPIVDQAVFNYIIQDPSYRNQTRFSDHQDGWAIQLGTTRGAVESSRGDLGVLYSRNLSGYEEIYEGDQPRFSDGVVSTQDGIPYCIVHQYDRVDGFREIVERKYG